MYDQRSESCGLGLRLRIAFLSQHLRHIPPIDEDIGHKAIVDISSPRDDAYRPTVEQHFQPQPGCLPAWLVQFRRVDVSESDSLGPISKGVAIDHLDLPTVDRALDATEWRGGLSTKDRSETLAAGSAQPFGFFVRMESLLTVASQIAPCPCVWSPAEVAGRANSGFGCPGSQGHCGQ